MSKLQNILLNNYAFLYVSDLLSIISWVWEKPAWTPLPSLALQPRTLRLRVCHEKEGGSSARLNSWRCSVLSIFSAFNMNPWKYLDWYSILDKVDIKPKEHYKVFLKPSNVL